MLPPPNAARSLVVILGALLCLGPGCASGGARLGRVGRIPPLLGADRVEVSATSDADALAERSAAERERGQGAAAERYARWALARSPEHVGGLVAAARVAVDAGLSETARSLWALAADRGPAVARAIDAERGAVLLGLARAELAAGRVERAESLWRELETETPQYASAQRRARLEMAMTLADTWLGRALPTAGRDAVTAAERLGAGASWVKSRRLELEILGGEVEPDASAEGRGKQGEAKASSAPGARPGSPAPDALPRDAAGEGARLGASPGTSGGASPGLSGPAMEARALAELGRDGERWQGLARWLLAVGRLEDAALAARRAVAGDEADPAAWEVVAEVALARDLVPDAVTAWTEAARRKKAGGAELAWAGARRLAERGKLDGARALEALTRELAPGAEVAVRAAAAEGARTLGPPRAGTARASAEEQEAALGILVATARSAPASWAELIAAPQLAADRRRVAAILRAAREAGLVSWEAALVEAEAWREVREEPETAQREADKAFEAALAGVKASEVGRLLEAGRVAFTVGLPGWPERVSGVAAGGPAAAYMAAMRDRGEVDKARRALEGKGAMAAFVRAHAILDGRLGADAWRAAREAVDEARVMANAEDGGPAPEELAAYALRVMLRAGPSEAKRLERAASAWLATREEAVRGPRRDAALTPGWLLTLRSQGGLSADLQLAVREAILAERSLDGLYDALAVEQERAALLLSSGRVASLFAVWTEELARLEGGATTRRGLVGWIEAPATGARSTRGALVEKALEKAISRGSVDFVNFFVARLHPEELRQAELVPKLVELFEGRGERGRVRRLVEATLARSQAGQVQTPRMLALATQLLELGYPDLAARGFEQVLAAGDRSSQAWVGAVRASLRMAQRGLGAGAGGEAARGGAADTDALVNRWLDARQRRDARTVDEAARLMSDEGELGRAIDLLTGRLLGEDGAPRNDVSVLQPLAEALRRAGKTESLITVGQRVAVADPRSASRSQAMVAQRLIEAGALEAARDIIVKALETRARDTQLLSVGVMVSLGSGQSARTFASAMLREAGTSWDVWDRVVGDLRNAGQVETALTVLGEGLERYPGAARLLAARARVHTLAGQPEAAAADFAEALARASTAREVIDLAEPLYKQALRPELLVDLLGRAAAMSPGRADISTQLGKWLIEAGRPDEAQLVFGRLTSESDRASAALAAAWAQGGYLGSALEQWQRAFDPGPVAELVQAFDAVSRALVRRGEPERLEPFVRLYLQAVRGAAGPPLLPVARAFRELGRREEASRWFERAERETPTAELSMELCRARLEAGDDELALAAAERAISRRAGASGSGRLADATLVSALEPVVNELIGAARPALARELVRRVALSYGPSPAMRLFAAQAMVSDNDIAGALAELDGPMPSWRVSRDLLPVFRSLLEQLAARGHIDLALGLVTRALETGAERELLLAQLRLAARAGYPEVAIAAGRRLVAEVPTLNTWVVGDALVAERMPGAAWGTEGSFGPLRDALGKLPNGAALARAVLAAEEHGMDAVLAAVPRTREDLVTARQLRASLASIDQRPGAAARVVDALLPLLSQAPADPSYTRLALLSAAAVDASSGHLGERVGAVVDQLLRASPDRAKLIRNLAADLMNAQRFAAASALYERLRDSDAGDGALTHAAFSAALAAGDRAAAARWAESALGRSTSGLSLTLRLTLVNEALARVVGDDAGSNAALELARDLLTGPAGDASAAPEAPEACEGRLCGSGRALARARVALAEARDATGWARAREHLEAWVKAAPDETTARVDAAELALGADAARVRAPGLGAAPSGGESLAKSLIEPLLARDNPPSAALELGLELATQRASADAAWRRLSGRFTLAPTARRTRRILARLVELDARETDARPGPLSALWVTLPVAPRRALLLELVAARNARREPLGPETQALLASELTGVAPADPTGVRLQLQRLRALGDRPGALAVVQHALALAPWSSEIAALLAESLALDDGSTAALTRASQLLAEVLSRPPETSLTGAEERFQTAPVNPAVYESLAIVEAARGRQGEAREALGRALASYDTQPLDALYDRTARLLFAHPALAAMAPASLAECARRASPAWSGRCAARLSPD